MKGECSVCAWFSLGSLAGRGLAAGVAAAAWGPLVRTRSVERQVPGGPHMPRPACRLSQSCCCCRRRRGGGRSALRASAQLARRGNQPLAPLPRCRFRRGDALSQSFILADSHGCCDLPRALASAVRGRGYLARLLWLLVSPSPRALELVPSVAVPIRAAASPTPRRPHPQHKTTSLTQNPHFRSEAKIEPGAATSSPQELPAGAPRDASPLDRAHIHAKSNTTQQLHRRSNSK